MSGPGHDGFKVTGDRDQVFAQAALKKGLVSRDQARECLKIARGLAAKNKPVAIELVFVRKGYLRQAEATGLAKRIVPKGQAPLALAPAPSRARAARCPSCKRNPGDEADCYHCGADLESGGPGPRGTICESCAGIVLKGSAICFHCGETMRAPRRRVAGRDRSWLDRLVVLATVLGVGYFLVYRGLVAPPPGPEADPAPAASPDSDPPTELALREAAELVRAAKPAEAVTRLTEALSAASPAGQVRLQRALALVADGEPASQAARAALAAGEDPLLRRRLAALAWARGEVSAAKAELEQIPETSRADEDWRLLAAVERKAAGKGDRAWEAALLRIKSPLPGEKVPLASALWRRGLEHLAVERLDQAQADLERAVDLDPERAALHRSLGALYLKRGKPAEARASYQLALNREPNGPPAVQLGLALALEALNERVAARRFLEDYLTRAAAAGEPAERVAAAKARLERLVKAPEEQAPGK